MSIIFRLYFSIHFHYATTNVQAFGGTDYSFLSTTTSTPDSVHSVKKDITQQQQQQISQSSNQQSTPTSSIKKKKSMVNLFTCAQPQSSCVSSSNASSSSSTHNHHQQPTQSSSSHQQMTPAQQQMIPSSLCDTATTVSSKHYNAFNNISFDTNLDFLSFVSLYRSFR